MSKTAAAKEPTVYFMQLGEMSKWKFAVVNHTHRVAPQPKQENNHE